MADLVDLSSDYSDRLVEDQLSSIRRERPVAKGFCLYCEEPVTGVFCPPSESDCRDSWEKEQQLLKQNGKHYG